MCELLEWVNSEIDKIDKDERYHYAKADIFTNAPLALIQLDMSSKMSVLKKVKDFLEGE